MSRTSPLTKTFISMLCLLTLLGSGACSPRPQDCGSPRVFCVGLVTDFGDVSAGIAAEAWTALQDAKDQGLVDRIDRVETVDTRDRSANINYFASYGYDLIVTVGSSIADETAAAAQQYPSLLFIGIEQPQTTKIPNLASLVFHEEQSGFLAGVLAALTTRTRRVAAVCEAKFLDPVRRYCEGFREGAKYADPSVSVDVVYRDGSTDELYRDTAWSSAQALSEVQQGADILFAAGGDTALAALDAAASQNTLVIGTETDLYSTNPALRPTLLTCAVNDVRAGVLDLVRQARQGTLPGGRYFGSSSLSPFHDLDAAVSGASRARLLQVQKALTDGSLQLDIPYDNPSD